MAVKIKYKIIEAINKFQLEKKINILAESGWLVISSYSLNLRIGCILIKEEVEKFEE